MFSHQHFLIVLLALAGSSSAAKCKFSKSNVNAQWKTTNGAVQIQYQNKNIGNNQWTAIGFGPGMQNQGVIVFLVQNNQVTVRTGSTSGFGPPTFDSNSGVNVQSVNLSGSTLNAVITVPSSFNGFNLQNCQTWNFVQTGPLSNGSMRPHSSVPDQVNNVCASQCT